MQTKLQEAIFTLGALTRWYYNVWDLAGPRFAKGRAALMAELLGVPKVPQSKSGVTALEAEFYRQCGVSGETPSRRQEAFAQKCRVLVPPPYEGPCWTHNGGGAECGRANVETTADSLYVRCRDCTDLARDARRAEYMAMDAQAATHA